MKSSISLLLMGGVTCFIAEAVPAGPPLTYSNIGCWSDAVAPRRTLEGPLVDLLKNGHSPLNCAQACSNLGWSLAGLENANECWCGSGLNAIAEKLNQNRCNMKCTGDDSMTCGGGWAIDIYRIATPADIVRPTFDPPPFPPVSGKIILEEHANTNVFPAAFSYPYYNNTNEIFFGKPSYSGDVARRLNGSDPIALTQRVAEMDKANVSLAIISLVPPGIQGILDPELAVKLAPNVNDEYSAIYGSGRYSSRFRFFCSVALQNPAAAVTEMQRCMSLPGAVGVFLAGYTNTGGNQTAANTVILLDEPMMEPFWKAAAALGVPVYLHSRMPKPDQQDVYRGYEWMGGSVWGFSTEVAVETLRLMQSGLFDRYPNLQIILGHLGEGISFSLYRMDQRIRHYTKTWAAQKTIQHYWENNIIITTSGVQSDSAFWDAMKTTTPDRVMFSADTPFETMPEMAGWFDRLEMNSITKAAISSGNARKWFKLDKP